MPALDLVNLIFLINELSKKKKKKKKKKDFKISRYLTFNLCLGIMWIVNNVQYSVSLRLVAQKRNPYPCQK